MGCELCDLVNGNIITRFYYRNKTCIIVDCSTCSIPMVVLAHHSSASDEEKRLIMATINYLFEYQSIRTEPRKITDHEHWHLEGVKLKE